MVCNTFTIWNIFISGLRGSTVRKRAEERSFDSAHNILNPTITHTSGFFSKSQNQSVRHTLTVCFKYHSLTNQEDLWEENGSLATLGVPRRPSLVVDVDNERHYFSDGIARGLTNKMSQSRRTNGHI